MAVEAVEAPGRSLLTEGQEDPGSGESCPHLWKREDHASVPHFSALRPTESMTETLVSHTLMNYIFMCILWPQIKIFPQNVIKNITWGHFLQIKKLEDYKSNTSSLSKKFLLEKGFVFVCGHVHMEARKSYNYRQL